MFVDVMGEGGQMRASYGTRVCVVSRMGSAIGMSVWAWICERTLCITESELVSYKSETPGSFGFFMTMKQAEEGTVLFGDERSTI